MGFGEAVQTCFKKAVTFKGRARRSEFWYWYLFTFLVSIATSIVSAMIPSSNILLTTILSIGTSVWGIFTAIATFAVATRRLHDTGRSGWWYGVTLILGFVCAVWFFIQLFGMAIDIPNVDAMTSTEGITLILSLLGKMLIPFLISFIYGIVLLVWLCTDSQPGTNKYGANPKEAVPLWEEVATTQEVATPVQEKTTDNKSEGNYNKEI